MINEKNKNKLSRKQLITFLNEMCLKIPEGATGQELEKIVLKYARGAYYPFLSEKLQAFLNAHIQNR